MRCVPPLQTHTTAKDNKMIVTNHIYQNLTSGVVWYIAKKLLPLGLG